MVWFAERVSGPNGTVTVPASTVEERAAFGGDTLGRGLWLLTALLKLGRRVPWFIAGRALRPVEAIRSEVLAISGDHDAPAGAGARRARRGRRLAETMNEMLDRLERTSSRQREFVSDASTSFAARSP